MIIGFHFFKRSGFPTEVFPDEAQAIAWVTAKMREVDASVSEGDVHEALTAVRRIPSSRAPVADPRAP